MSDFLRSLTRLKPLEEIYLQQSETLDHDVGGRSILKRTLTVKDLLGLGVGMVIGTGIFTLTGVEAKHHAGPAVVVSYILAGLIAACAALCYSEMASSVPAAGSAYTYAFATLGEVFAWIIGWDLILEFALGAAVVSRGWSGYLKNLFDLPPTFFGETSIVNIGAIVIAVLLGVVAMIGAKQSAWVTNTLVIIKVSVCIFVIILGAFFVKTSNLVPFIPEAEAIQSASDGVSKLEVPLIQILTGAQGTAFGIGGILAAAAVVFFAYSGFEVVANMGEETKKPQRDLARGVMGTLAICTALYAGVSFVLVGMVRYSELDEGAPVADAFKQVGLGQAGALIAVAAICGLTSVILVDIIGMGRIGFAMARDGLLPRVVAKVHPKWGTPYVMTAATTVLVAALGGFVSLRALADMVSIGTLFAFVVVSAAVPILRKKRPNLKRPFRVPFGSLIPVISVLACLYMMINLSFATWIRFLVWMALGFLMYFVFGQRHSHAGEWAETEE